MRTDRQTNGQTDRQTDVPMDMTKLLFFVFSMRKRKYESGNFVTRLASTDTYGLLESRLLSSGSAAEKTCECQSK
jgi:hypothetical protein